MLLEACKSNDYERYKAPAALTEDGIYKVFNMPSKSPKYSLFKVL